MWNCETFRDRAPKDTFQKPQECLFCFTYHYSQEMRIKQISMLSCFGNFDTIALQNMIFPLLWWRDKLHEEKTNSLWLKQYSQQTGHIIASSWYCLLWTIFSIIPSWVILNSFFYCFIKKSRRDELQRSSFKNTQLSPTCLSWKATDKEFRIWKTIESLWDVLVAIIDAESNSSVVPWQLLFYVELQKKAFVFIE